MVPSVGLSFSTIRRLSGKNASLNLSFCPQDKVRRKGNLLSQTPFLISVPRVTPKDGYEVTNAAGGQRDGFYDSRVGALTSYLALQFSCGLDKMIK